MKKVVAITSSRADYSHMHWPLKALHAHPDIELTVIAFGPHMSPEFGHSWAQIRADGFTLKTVESLLSSDSDVGMAKSLAISMLGLTEQLASERPDVLLLIADRYEMLAAANVALTLRIPIAHIEGGDVSEGAIDDAVRNAITKMSHLHFTPTALATRRVEAMGEEAWRITRSGAPSLDHLRHPGAVLPADQVNTQLGLTPAPLWLVLYHPVTLFQDTVCELDALLTFLQGRTQQIVFCFPNSDAGAHRIIERVQAFCRQHAQAQVRVNLPPPLYLGLLARSELMLGNSSSGIMESPSFKVPAIDIGLRQSGREKATNIVAADASAEAIERACEIALSERHQSALAEVENPYGDGRAAERICAVLADLPARERLLFKRNTLLT